jgi:hypothetical protein
MKHYDASDVAERLIKGADDLFNARAEMRREHHMLQDVYDDATAYGPALYADPLVKETRDMMQELDNAIGIVARQMEHLARQIEKLEE